MSALLRALMGQQVGGDDKPNLAVITESTVSTDALGKRTLTPAGVTANVKKGVTYNVVFDFTMDFTESSGAGLVELGNYAPWGDRGFFFREDVSDVPQVIKRNVNVNVTTNYYVSDTDKGLMFWTVNNKKGTLHIYNLVITEV